MTDNQNKNQNPPAQEVSPSVRKRTPDEERAWQRERSAAIRKLMQPAIDEAARASLEHDEELFEEERERRSQYADEAERAFDWHPSFFIDLPTCFEGGRCLLPTSHPLGDIIPGMWVTLYFVERTDGIWTVWQTGSVNDVHILFCSETDRLHENFISVGGTPTPLPDLPLEEIAFIEVELVP